MCAMLADTPLGHTDIMGQAIGTGFTGGRLREKTKEEEESLGDKVGQDQKLWYRLNL